MRRFEPRWAPTRAPSSRPTTHTRAGRRSWLGCLPRSTEVAMTPSLLDAFDAHVSDVYGYFAYRFLPAADVEGLTRVTFERAAGAWQAASDDVSLKRWLLGIARRVYGEY